MNNNKFTIILVLTTILCLTIISCHQQIDVNKYDVVTIAKVDTFVYNKSGMRVIFNYFVENKKYSAYLTMSPEKMIPKGFPIYIRYSSTNQTNYKILIDSSAVIYDSLQVRYMHKTVGGFTYKIEKRRWNN
ncbi:MAG: hypothetical protein WBI53_13655 [Paludibacter sp.]